MSLFVCVFVGLSQESKVRGPGLKLDKRFLGSRTRLIWLAFKNFRNSFLTQHFDIRKSDGNNSSDTLSHRVTANYFLRGKIALKTSSNGWCQCILRPRKPSVKFYKKSFFSLEYPSPHRRMETKWYVPYANNLVTQYDKDIKISVLFYAVFNPFF